MSDPRTLSEQALTSGDIADLLRVGVPVHLQNCSFIGVDCAEADLAEWRFEKCDLRRANLDHCILEDVVFSGCRSVEASFRFARFSQVAFKDNDLSNTSFKHSQFADVAFEGCKMLGVDFTDTTTNELAFKEVQSWPFPNAKNHPPRCDPHGGEFRSSRPHMWRFSQRTFRRMLPTRKQCK